MSEKRSTMLIEKFLSFQKHKLRDLDDEPDKALQLDDYEKILFDAVTVLEDELMSLEMVL